MTSMKSRLMIGAASMILAGPAAVMAQSASETPQTSGAMTDTAPGSPNAIQDAIGVIEPLESSPPDRNTDEQVAATQEGADLSELARQADQPDIAETDPVNETEANEIGQPQDAGRQQMAQGNPMEGAAMQGQMGERMQGQMHGQMGERMQGQMGQMQGQMHGQMGQMHEQMREQMHGQMQGQMQGAMDSRGQGRMMAQMADGSVMVLDVDRFAQDVYEMAYRQGYMRGANDVKRQVAQSIMMERRQAAQDRSAVQNQRMQQMLGSAAGGQGDRQQAQGGQMQGDMRQAQNQENRQIIRPGDGPISSELAARPGGSIVVLPPGVTPEAFIAGLMDRNGG